MLSLKPCPSCSRHVRTTEPACPFCGGPLGDSLWKPPPPDTRVSPRARLVRASVAALGGTAAIAAIACSSAPVVDYGAVVFDDGGYFPSEDAGGRTGADAEAITTPDGGSTSEDASSADASDAETTDAPVEGDAGDGSAIGDGAATD